MSNPAIEIDIRPIGPEQVSQGEYLSLGGPPVALRDLLKANATSLLEAKDAGTGYELTIKFWKTGGKSFEPCGGLTALEIKKDLALVEARLNWHLSGFGHAPTFAKVLLSFACTQGHP